MTDTLPDLYVSCDVETDGPIPGDYSLLSFGLVVVAGFDGDNFQLVDDPPTFYREIRPITDKFDPEALAVNGLDRSRLQKEGADPGNALQEAYDWVINASSGYRPVLVGYPAVFDWMWMFWYFTHFVPAGSPFNYSDCVDIKTMLLTKLGRPFGAVKRSSLPPFLASDRPHTHHALEDAIEQGELFARLFQWKHGSGDD